MKTIVALSFLVGLNVTAHASNSNFDRERYSQPVLASEGWADATHNRTAKKSRTQPKSRLRSHTHTTGQPRNPELSQISRLRSV